VKPTLIFVYNADGGFLDRLTDAAHKLLSPSTYSCHLCAITHGATGMHREWRDFLKSLDVELAFHHRDEWRDDWGPSPDLPVILHRTDAGVAELVSAEEIEGLSTQEQLRHRLLSALESGPGAP